MTATLPPGVVFRIHIHAATKMWTKLCPLASFRWKPKVMFFRIPSVIRLKFSSYDSREPPESNVTCFLSEGTKLRNILQKIEHAFMVTNTCLVYGIIGHPSHIFHFTFCCLFGDVADSAMGAPKYANVGITLHIRF